jgi:Zn-dependent peptidase ImmA (M78 family)/DNA-binding XRE family transcriptional regulator
MFSGRRIRQARELRRLTQSEFADKVGVGQSAIAHIESGFKSPSRALIARIAAQTQFPVSFFASDPSSEFSVQSLLFRAKASMTKRDASEACRYAELLNEIVEGMATHLTEIPLTLPASTKDPSAAAKRTRDALQIPSSEPIPHLVNSVEKAGVRILALPASLSGRDAFALWTQRQSGALPLIAVSSDRPGDRLRFSLAHELGHVVMHHVPRIDPEQEKRAHEFAAELLMPEMAMRREIVTPITLSSIAVLKTRWRVSIQALVKRAYDLHLVTERQYRYLFELLATKGWRTREPSNLDVPLEKPRALRQMAELVYGNPIDYDRMAADTRLSVRFLRQVVELYAESPKVETKQQNSPRKVVSFAKP